MNVRWLYSLSHIGILDLGGHFHRNSLAKAIPWATQLLLYKKSWGLLTKEHFVQEVLRLLTKDGYKLWRALKMVTNVSWWLKILLIIRGAVCSWKIKSWKHMSIGSIIQCILHFLTWSNIYMLQSFTYSWSKTHTFGDWGKTSVLHPNLMMEEYES